MKKLKFSKDEGSDFYRELHRQVEAYFREKGLSKTGNAKMRFKMAMYFALDILFYSLMMRAESKTEFVIYYLLMGLSVLLTAFNVSHDAAHGVAVKSKRLNKFLFSLSFNLQGNNAYVWGKNHNESHHLYTNIAGSDIDVLHNPLFRMSHEQKLRWYHRYQYLYAPFLYVLYSLNWFVFREGLMLFNLSSRTIQVKIPLIEVLKLILFKALYITYMIVLPMYVLPFSYGTILLVFVLNHFMVSLLFVGVLGVSHLSDYVEHPTANENNELAMSWPKLQLCTSLDYNSDSKFLNWTLGGFNAHALHHLLPDVCHVHYLEILPIFRSLIEKHNLKYLEVNYRTSVASHFRFLKLMGTQH